MTRYQDYVIKDGKFIGQFDEMYRDWENPWHQMNDDHCEYSQSKNAAILWINKYGIKSVLEVGCGLGHYSALIEQKSSAKVLGIDVSPIAIYRAKKQFPQISFRVASAQDLPWYPYTEAILFAEVSWYLLPELKGLFECMLDKFPGKYFIHNLTFYRPGVQKYGVEYFTTLEKFIEYCPLKLLESVSCVSKDAPDAIDTSSIFKIERK